MASPAIQQTCTRCGVFVASRGEGALVDLKLYCAACAVRPEVNYLETFRLKYWGRRDVWAWLIGVGGLANGLLLFSNVMSAFSPGGVPGEALPRAAGNMLAITVATCFFLGLPWARYGLFASLLINGGIGVALSPQGATAALLGAMVFPLIVIASIFNDTRNRLFFKLEVDRSALRKAWELYANNATARAGFLLGLFSLLLWPAGPVGLLVSIIGLRRVDPSAQPPIGRKGQAIAGIVFSSLGTIAFVAMAISLMLKTG